MAEEIEKVPVEENKTPETPLETPSNNEEVPSQTNTDDVEIQKKKEELANLEKAKAEALRDIQELRKERKELKETPSNNNEEIIPEIDDDDPASKAWSKRIDERTAPANATLEKQKEEIFDAALEEFMEEHPALAQNAEKRKEFVSTYEALKSNSGLTKEGVSKDLKRAFGATYSTELESRAREVRLENVKDDILFSDPGVSRGGGPQRNQVEKEIQLSDEQRAILAKWGITPAEWLAENKKFGNK